MIVETGGKQLSFGRSQVLEEGRLRDAEALCQFGPGVFPRPRVEPGVVGHLQGLVLAIGQPLGQETPQIALGPQLAGVFAPGDELDLRKTLGDAFDERSDSGPRGKFDGRRPLPPIGGQRSHHGAPFREVLGHPGVPQVELHEPGFVDHPGVDDALAVESPVRDGRRIAVGDADEEIQRPVGRRRGRGRPDAPLLRDADFDRRDPRRIRPPRPRSGGLVIGGELRRIVENA